MQFVSKYFQRLELDPTKLDDRPTFDKLCAIQESHVRCIPYENTAQHGLIHHGPATLDLEATSSKILDHHRGGFCLELNLLLAEFLKQLGYQVHRVPGIVYNPLVEDYRAMATHAVLIVTCLPHTTQSSTCFVDVGFGEPPIHPLRFGDGFWNKEQGTPDGMRSKLALERIETNRESPEIEKGANVVLYWIQAGVWKPRLKWNYQASLNEEATVHAHLEEALKCVLDPESGFSLKLIVCRLTRNEKVTLAGNRLKITGPPRFPPNATDDSLTDANSGTGQAPVQNHFVESEDEARKILLTTFGIPLSQTTGLDFSKSLQSSSELFGHF